MQSLRQEERNGSVCISSRKAIFPVCGHPKLTTVISTEHDTGSVIKESETVVFDNDSNAVYCHIIVSV